MSMIRVRGLCVDPDNLPALRREMDRHGEAHDIYAGRNELGERIRVFVTHDRLELRTQQANGWRRVNVYRREGPRTVDFDQMVV